MWTWEAQEIREDEAKEGCLDCRRRGPVPLKQGELDLVEKSGWG